MDEIAVPQSVVELANDIAVDMVVIALVVISILTVAKQVGSVLDSSGSRCLDRVPVQIVLHLAPLALGLALAAGGGAFADYPLDLRLMLGLISGFLAPGIYSSLKRIMPGVMLGKEARVSE